jgi:hypothetical protein
MAQMEETGFRKIEEWILENRVGSKISNYWHLFANGF